MAKNPVELARKLEYEKPIINDDFYGNAFKDGYKLKGNEARLGKGRLDDLIDYYGKWDNSDYSKAYLTYINPKDFLDLSFKGDNKNDPLVNEIEGILKNNNLDLERINNAPYTPFLEMDFDNNTILNHDGRHRLAAFASAGIDKVPIVIKGAGKSFDKTRTQPYRYYGNVKGQNLGPVRAPGKQNMELDLTPLNYKNAPLLWDKFGYNE